MIQKYIEKVQKILEELKGIKSMASIETRKRNIVTHMRNEVGDIEAWRRGIADTFATFYEDLYSSGNNERKDEKDTTADLRIIATMLTMMKNIEDDEPDRHIPEFTMKELIIEIYILKKGKIGRLQRNQSGRSQRS